MRDRALSGRIRLTATRGALRGSGVTVIADGPPQIAGGVGGWHATDRARRRPAKWWQGGTEMTQTIEGILDMGVTGDVAASLRHLRQLGTTAGAEDQPPAVRLTGDVTDLYSINGGLWVMQGLSLGERLFRSDGQLRRQAVTIELVDFDDAPTIAPVSVRRTRASARAPRTRTITTRRGDTMRAIAVREVGSSGAWTKIRDWNPKLFKGTRPPGPDDPLRAGTVVTIK